MRYHEGQRVVLPSGLTGTVKKTDWDGRLIVEYDRIPPWQPMAKVHGGSLSSGAREVTLKPRYVRPVIV